MKHSSPLSNRAVKLPGSRGTTAFAYRAPLNCRSA
jgi:hypothetical protein